MPPSNAMGSGDRSVTEDGDMEVDVMSRVEARIRGCGDSIVLSNEGPGVGAVAVLEGLVLLVHPRAILNFCRYFPMPALLPSGAVRPSPFCGSIISVELYRISLW